MRIAVTGASGFLGRYLVDRIATTGHQVLALGREMATLRPLLGDQIEVCRSDYSASGLAQVLRGTDVVVHLASARMTRETDPHILTQFNQSMLATTENVLLAAADAGVRRVCLASSQSVYSGRNALPFRESEAAQPANVYGVAKLACEKLASLVGELRGLEVLNLRLARLYGTGDRPGLMIPTFIERAQKGETLHVTGTGQRRIDQLYVKDSAVALESAAVGAVAGGTFNIGSGRASTLKEYAETINSVFGNEGNIAFDGSPQDAGEDIEMDSTLAKDVLGWTPRWTLVAALEEMRGFGART